MYAGNELTLEELVGRLSSCADRDAAVEVDLGGDVADVPLEDLGFDSLAVFNVVSELGRDCGVTLSYDEIAQARTPQGLVKLVNEALRPVS